MTDIPSTALPWDQPEWLPEATAWIDAQLAAHAIATTGPIEIVHQRPWSAIARVPTAGGSVYFKAPAPAYPHEAPLTEALARWRPDVSVPLLAVDHARGWLLSADAGSTLRSADSSPAQIAHWLKLLPEYAALQIEMAPRVPALLALGMPDRRLTQLPRLYAAVLEDRPSLLIDQAGGLTAAEYTQLLALRPRVEAWCAQLAGYGLPETLVHEEVHDANVLFAGDRYIYTDWSDSSVGHPFFTMLVTIRAAAHRLGLAEAGPELLRLRDAYLEAWTAFGSRTLLEEAYQLAYRLAMINRALSWHSGIAALAQRHKAPYADSVPGWLQDFGVAAAADGSA